MLRYFFPTWMHFILYLFMLAVHSCPKSCAWGKTPPNGASSKPRSRRGHPCFMFWKFSISKSRMQRGWSNLTGFDCFKTPRLQEVKTNLDLSTQTMFPVGGSDTWHLFSGNCCCCRGGSVFSHFRVWCDWLVVLVCSSFGCGFKAATLLLG